MGLIDGLLGHAGETPVEKLAEDFAPLLAPGEPLQRAFSTIRDLIVFTDRRVMLVKPRNSARLKQATTTNSENPRRAYSA